MEGTKSAFADSPATDPRRESSAPPPACGSIQSAKADFVLFLPRFQPTALPAAELRQRFEERDAAELLIPILDLVPREGAHPRRLKSWTL
jgi:hypothetical protein